MEVVETLFISVFFPCQCVNCLAHLEYHTIHMKPHTQLRFTVNENSIYSMSYDVPLPCDLFRSFNLSNWTRCSLCYRGHGKFSASICLIFWDREQLTITPIICLISSTLSDADWMEDFAAYKES